MVLKVFFTDDEVGRFFKDNGYVIEDRPFGRFEKVAHNRDEWVEYHRPAVVIDDRFIEARKLFEKVAEAKVKKMICPSNMETRRMIEKQFKNQFKNPLNGN